MYPTTHRLFSLPQLGFQTRTQGIRKAVLAGFLTGLSAAISAQFDYDWPAHSALSEGQWFRIATTKTGFHKVDVAVLEGLGIDPTAVNPGAVNLYGHGGDALPIDNALPRPLDLVPVPIEMVDDGDAQFDGSDHFIFMGDGPDQWTYDDGSGRWRHDINPWSDTAWYFLRVDDVVPVRVPTEPGLGGDVDAVLTATDFHQYHELEQSTIIRSGRNFYGEVFDQNPTHTIPFQVPDILPEPARLEVRLMGRSVGAASPYEVVLGDSAWTILPPVTGSQTYVSQARVGAGNWAWTPSSELVQVGLTLDAQVADAKGWLDYVRISGTRQASMSGGSQQACVRAAEAGPGRIVEWTISEAQSVQRVWDVTDAQNPIAVPFEIEEGTLRFRTEYSDIRTFRAGNGSGFYTPTPIGPVQNTNVHGLPQVVW